LRELNELQVREGYEIESTERDEGVDFLRDDEDINSAWEIITGYIKTSTKYSIGLHELKQHKPWVDEERSYFISKKAG
jgi:hypothetical protein